MTVKLRYHKGSKEKMAWAAKHGIDGRLWDVLTPLPGYTYTEDSGVPTLTVEGLKERGII